MPRLTLAILVLAAGGAAGATGAMGQPQSCILIENFSRAPAGQFPTEWKARDDAGKNGYVVLEEGGQRFLRAESQGLGVQAARQYEWNLDEYPILTWSWRPRRFPDGSDERQSRTNDSALAVYVLVPHSRTRGPKAVKYIWSERVPAGERLSSNGGLTQVRVVRSGPAGAGQWQEERVNVRDDYRAFFGEPRTPRPAGIAVLTDSDDTRSSAVGDYANFRACRA
jgi:hypothetical protein